MDIIESLFQFRSDLEDAINGQSNTSDYQAGYLAGLEDTRDNLIETVTNDVEGVRE